MVNCKQCGAELKEGDAFCQSCGAAVTPVTEGGQLILDLAGWGDRILAWIIDMILLGVIIGVLESIFILPSVVLWGGLNDPVIRQVPFIRPGGRELLYFLYFVWMDLSYGQSLGKMVMKIRVTNLDGGPINITQSAIQAFGKAFLLPIDLILGWIFMSQKSQRIFTYLAKTIVVKDKSR